MALGVRSAKYTFDILDNSYVTVQMGKVESGWVISENTDTFLRKCTIEESITFYGVWYTTYEGNMLCLDEPDKLRIRSNWFEPDYDNPYFMISEC